MKIRAFQCSVFAVLCLGSHEIAEEGKCADESCDDFVLSPDVVNSKIRSMKYAVRGELVLRAQTLALDLESQPFEEVL
jgi:hypothetical protein